MEKLVLGVAYHGNRILSQVREDMNDIVEHGFNTVVHMLTHTDMDRARNNMKEIVKMSKEAGLDVWIDNWGISGMPGETSHFLGANPGCQQMYNDGTCYKKENGPAMVCYNREEFVEFTKEWIDIVADIKASTIFWDEPIMLGGVIDENGFQKDWACRCPKCQELFKEQYGYDMPVEINQDIKFFRAQTIVNYLRKATDYAHSLGLKNSTCVVGGERYGMCLEYLDTLASLPHLDILGSDPYMGNKMTYQEGYKFVYKHTKQTIEIAKQFGKEGSVWLACYNGDREAQKKVMIAADAAYDAGARQIFYWSFKGGDACDYRSEVPALSWYLTGVATSRILNRYYDECTREAVKELGL